MAINYSALMEVAKTASSKPKTTVKTASTPTTKINTNDQAVANTFNQAAAILSGNADSYVPGMQMNTSYWGLTANGGQGGKNQLFGNNSFAADGMSQQKFRRFVLFFFTENTDCTKRSIKCSAESQNIAAFNSIKPYKRPEVQTVHTECFGKRAHRGKHVVDALHLSFHFREQKNTGCKKKSDSNCPY